MSQLVSDVEIKKVNAGNMLAILVTKSYDKMATAVEQLAEWMEQKLVTPSCPFFTIFYDTIMEPEEGKVKFEVCVQVDKAIEGEDIITCREDIEQEMAAATFTGPYDQINVAYDAIFAFMQENSYAVNGASREVYVVSPQNSEIADPSKYVTEIQFPVKKI